MSMPNVTPNVTITNPTVRRYVRTATDVIGLLIVAVMTFDALSGMIDWDEVMVPALAVWGVFRAGFGFGVDSPNTPKPDGPVAVMTVEGDDHV